ncbi:MAG: response regulator transcription factor [Anaerolineales bacterium]|nr:response regulator transcription factor [Anaerolineales bacterium]
MSQEQIRVLVVDDHIIVREGITSLLEAFADLELVGEAENGRQAVNLCVELQPDVILMDLVMPEMSGIDAIRAIKQRYRHVQVLALTSYTNRELVKGALEAGAIGYLLKNVSAFELAQAIRNAHKAEPTLAPEATQSLLDVMARPAANYGLTEREKEVLQQVVRGKKNEQIAETLNISISTVKNHVSSILKKLDVTTRTAAASKAIKEKLADK